MGQASTRKSHNDEYADAAKIEHMLQHPEAIDAIIQKADNPLVYQALYAHKDYNLDCRNRITRLVSVKK